MRLTDSFTMPPWTVVPTDEDFVVPIDSTWIGKQATTALLTGSAYLAPGPHRGMCEKAVVTWSCATTGQNVTVDEQVLTGVAGTASDWETQGSGTVTITAGTTTQREFTPYNADWRLLVTAGATAPTTIIFRVMVHFTRDRNA